MWCSFGRGAETKNSLLLNDSFVEDVEVAMPNSRVWWYICDLWLHFWLETEKRWVKPVSCCFQYRLNKYDGARACVCGGGRLIFTSLLPVTFRYPTRAWLLSLVLPNEPYHKAGFPALGPSWWLKEVLEAQQPPAPGLGLPYPVHTGCVQPAASPACGFLLRRADGEGLLFLSTAWCTCCSSFCLSPAHNLFVGGGVCHAEWEKFGQGTKRTNPRFPLHELTIVFSKHLLIYYL